MRFWVLVMLWWTCVNTAAAQLVPLAKARETKVAPALQQSEIRQTDFLCEIGDTILFAQWLKKTGITSINKVAANLYRIKSNNNFLNNLHASGIRYIDRSRQAKVETVLGEFDIFANAVTAAHDQYPDITGKGRIISIKEKPFDQNDIDLKSRVVINDQFDEPSSLHATLMATLAAGAGNSSSFAKGVAFGASLTTSDFDVLLPDNSIALTQSGISVQNHSYGVGIETYYGIESKEYDRSISSAPGILHVFSSGNVGDQAALDGDYAGLVGYSNVSGQFKTSKNTIAVGSADRLGNVVARSSRGPTVDGRVKPEIIAFGDAGSSESAALVSGISVLLQEAYQVQKGILPDAALVKSILINSADDTGRPHVDYETGFGNVNALRALRTIKNSNFIEGEINENEELTFPISIPANQELVKVTLTWTDPAAEPFASKVLLHDLDLRIRNVDTNEEWLPWILDPTPSLASLEKVAVRGVDTLNNVEQVTIELPVGGNYEWIVQSKTLTHGPQKFFIAYEFASGFEWINPSSSAFFTAGAENVIRWNWYAGSQSAILEYKRVEEPTWIKIADVDLNERAYAWSIPEITGLVQVRMLVGSEFVYSPIVPISSFIRPSVNFNCDEEFMISWIKDPKATDYVIYQLGEKYLAQAQVTADTFAIIGKESFTGTQVAVAARYATKVGARQITIDYRVQGVDCYFVSVLPQAPIVYDDARINVVLGTVYNLKSATLERLRGTRVETLASIEPITTTTFSFSTTDLYPEQNQFRVKLITNDGKTIYSQEAEVYYVQENAIYIYPNPVAAGKDANIIVNSESEAEIFLVERSGKQILKAEDFGSIKIINTTNLTQGIYFIKVITPDGKVRNSKLIVL